MTESSGGIRRVTKREVHCVTAGGEIQNALSRINIFEMKLDNDRFLVVTRELIILGIANLKMCQEKAKLNWHRDNQHKDKCLPV